MPAVISKVGQILTAPENASVVGAVPAATDLIGNAAWTTAAAALLPDVLPAAGTLLSAGGARQLQAGSTVTHAGHFLMSPDNTYDIGANAATRPRTIYVGTSVLAPLFNNPAAAATTLGNSTYGVTVPGAATFSGNVTINNSAPWMLIEATTSGGPYLKFKNASHGRRWVMDSGGHTSFENTATSANLFHITSAGKVGVGNFYDGAGPTASLQVSGNLAVGYTQGTSPTVPSGGIVAAGDISMSKTSAQGYIYAYNTTGASYVRLYSTGVLSYVESTQNLNLKSGSGAVEVYNPGVDSNLFVTNGAGTSWMTVGSGSIATNSGNITIWPAGGTVAVTGGITASGVVSHGAYTVATLPSAGSNAGKMAQVTDSNVAASGNYGATVAAGGANRVKVFSDGTNWVIA